MITILWKKGYDVKIPIDDVTTKILSRDSNYILNVFMWPKFSNSSISMKEVITTSISQGFTRKTALLDGWSWFKFNNLGLALSTIHHCGKRVETKSQKVFGANSYVCRSWKGKTGRGLFWLILSRIGLKLNSFISYRF